MPILLVAITVCLVAWRLTALALVPGFAPAFIPAEQVRAAVLTSANRLQPDFEPLAQLGITRIEYQRFDPRALLVVTAGPDSRPGKAAADDNFNGVVDEWAELGATYSDDVCQLLTADQANDLTAETIMVLQRGAWVPVADSTHWQRANVFGRTSARTWSLMVERKDSRQENAEEAEMHRSE